MVNQELILFVRAELTKGKTQENIRAELLSGGGWTADDVDQVFGIVNPATPPPTVSPQAIMPVQPFEAMPVHKLIEQKPKSSFWKVFTIALFIILIGGAVFGFYLFKNGALGGLSKINNPIATPENEQKVQLKDMNAETPVIINDLIPSISKEGIYLDTKNGFQITPPEGWQKETSDSWQAYFTSGKNVSENANVSVQVREFTKNLDAYVDEYIKVTEKVMDSYKTTEKKEMIINGEKAIVLGFVSEFLGESGKTYQIFMAKNGKMYRVLSNIHPPSAWDKYKDEIEKSFDSFKLIK